MKLSEIKNLENKATFDSVEFVITQAKPEWGPKGPDKFKNIEFFFLVEDETGKSAVKYATKKNGNFVPKVGTRYRATAGKKQDGTLCGLFYNTQDKGCIHITDAGNIEEIGKSSSPSPSSNTSRPAPQQNQSTEIDPKEFIETFARSYLEVEKILSPILGEQMRPELITACMIQAERRGIQLIKPPKKRWQDMKVAGKSLGEFSKEELAAVVKKRLEKPYNSDLLNESFKEMVQAAGLNGSLLFMEASRLHGVEGDDAVDTILLKDFKTQEDITQDQMIDASIDQNFWKNVKDFIEERASALNSEAGASSFEDL